MSASTRRSVSDIKTTFEPKKDSSSSSPTSSTSAAHPSPSCSPAKPGALANMSSSKRLTQTQKPAQPSIDAILDHAASSRPPAIHQPSTKPSWIGPKPPERAPSPNPSIMQHTISIEYSSPGLRPPVYVCTSLSNPPWEPVEMETTQTSHGEYRFFKEFQAEEGEYQYKLRLGPGDWWTCDESKPKVDDGAGNENNLIVVKRAALVVPHTDELEPLERINPHAAPLMPHELNSHPDRKQAPSTPAVLTNNQPEPEPIGPLFRHESVALLEEGGVDGDDHEPESPPLLRHESVSPTSHEQEQSPLFRHESIAIDHKHAGHHSHHRHHHSNGQKQSDSSIPKEADPSDLSLEQFPTDHKGIMEHLDRTRRSLREDAMSEHRSSSSSQSRSPGRSAVASNLPSLSCLAEGEDELDGRPAKGDELTTEAIPHVQLFEPPCAKSATPMTPPLTPDEQDETERVQKPASMRETTKGWKGRAKKKAIPAKSSGLPAVAFGIAFTVAAASAALALWYIRAETQDILI